MPTIYEIAKKAGVAPSTVSKTLSNYSSVGEKTREKVMKVVNEMGYIPNLTAQSLKTNKSYLVGVVFSDSIIIGIAHQYYSVVLDSFRKAMGKYGYGTILMNKNLGNRKMGYIEHCKYRNLDGLVIMTAHPDDININELYESNIKCITTDVRFDRIPFVSSDNIRGSKIAIKYLYDMGHRKIAHISGVNSVIAFKERFLGYKKGLEEVGLSFDPSYYIEVDGFGHELGFKVAKKFINRFSEENRPTAIYVGADTLAIDTVQAIKSYGLRVPEDISIIGFDDTEASQFITPPLTTIAQDMRLIGETIADTIYKQMNDIEWNDEITKMPVRLIERSSVLKLPK